MPITPYARNRNIEAASMSRLARGTLQELPFETRMRMLRRSRRRLTVQRLADNLIWIVIVVAFGVVVATEFIAAVGRA